LTPRIEEMYVLQESFIVARNGYCILIGLPVDIAKRIKEKCTEHVRVLKEGPRLWL
jgi:hypothetical protein